MQDSKHLTRILIIDDDEDDFFITSEYIKKISDRQFRIDWCYKYNEAVKHIRNKDYNFYFIDYYLGAKTGLDLIKEAVVLQCEEPLVLLTGKGNQMIDKEAMQAGAMDYLVKSELNVEKVERCIRYSLERSASMKAIRLNERKFRSIFERSKDAVFLANEELVFRDVNDATTKLLGYSKEELLSLSLFQLLGSIDATNELKNILTEIREIEDKEIILTTQAGDIKYC